MNIAFFETELWEQEYFEQALHGHKLQFFSEPLGHEHVEKIRSVDILSTFIYSQWTQSVLSRLPNVRLIATRSTGYDHIDRIYATSRSIKIANVPTYGEHTVAEHTFALLLAITNTIVPSIERTRRGDFTVNGLKGMELFGKTFGVVGDGVIGRAVVAIALGFGMNVLVYSRHPDKRREKRNGFRYAPLDELYASSDIISYHIPETVQNHHFVNKDAFLHMKKGIILLNTARGGIIDTEALVWALESGIVQAAGLDVLEGERTLKEERQLVSKNFINSIDVRTQLCNHVLLTNPNVLITPHNAFNSKEALETILEKTVENIVSFIENGNPKYGVL